MNYSLKVLAVSTLLTLAFPAALLASQGADDSPGVSASPQTSVTASPSESPDVSETPEASETPKVSSSPNASRTPEAEDSDEPEPSKSPKASVSPRVSSSPKVSKTPEAEDVNDDQGDDDATETPEVKVPKDLKDDVDEILSEDDDVTKVEINQEEDRVEVKYRLRAKLFGLIEVPYELEAKVETREGETSVEAHGPWWLLFASDNADEVQSALQADETLTTETNQGSILSKIINILKSLAK